VNGSPLYYGWIVWCVATIGWIATSPGQAFSISLFVDDFIREFGLDRTGVSALFAAGTLMGALGLTWVGRGIDRYGNRRAAVLITALFALSLLAWTQIHSVWGLLLGLVAIRSLGQGALSLVNTTAIASWFWQRRGLVMSLSLMLFSLWQAAYVPLVQRLLEGIAWRQAWLLMGLIVGGLVLPLLWLLLRNRPEDYGMLPDGKDLYTKSGTMRRIQEDNWTLAETIKTPIFWIFIFGRIVSPAWGSGLILHNVSIFTSNGYDARTAAETYALLMVIGAGASLFFGWLIDRMRPGPVMSIQLAALSVAMVAGMSLQQPGMIWLYAVGFGLVMGGGGVFDTSVWTNLFGRAHQGEIRGFVSTILIAATAVGPILFGLSYDLLGSYTPVLGLGVLLAACPMVLALFTSRPRHRTVPALNVTVKAQPAAGD
jgi:MFS family permease